MLVSEMVKEFHVTFNKYMSDKIELPNQAERKFRSDLIREEFEELELAEAEDDIVEIADALGDLIYVIHGKALAYGIPLDLVVEEIHKSNMSKLGADGKPVLREDGKVLKGPNYFKPNIKKLLFG